MPSKILMTLLITMQVIIQNLIYQCQAIRQIHVLGMNYLLLEAKSLTVVRIMYRLSGTMSKCDIVNVSHRLYIYGGQDLKEGTFGDMWKLNIEFLYAHHATGAHTEGDHGLTDGIEIEGI